MTHRAFTLLETLVAILLVTLILTAAIHQWTSASTPQTPQTPTSHEPVMINGLYGVWRASTDDSGEPAIDWLHP